jgi:hypothetical protein
MNEKNELGINGGDNTSSDPAITRKEFIGKVVKGAAITGGVLLAPKVLDKFILPAQAAGTSTCNVASTKATGTDVATNNHGADVWTSIGHDTFCGSGP